MKIVCKNEKEKVDFESLKIGDCFLHRHNIYIKTEETYTDDGDSFNALNLQLMFFESLNDCESVAPLPGATLIY